MCRDFRGRSGIAIPPGNLDVKLDFEEFLVVEESLSRLAVNLVCDGGVIVGLGASEVDIVYGLRSMAYGLWSVV